MNNNNNNNEMEIATLANGCFWCTEAIFKKLKGVKSILPGYAGGTVKNPSYNQVCTGSTGHAESIQIKFDPSVISFEKILDIFWHTHDPTTLNRQGNDIGTQYRSAIFYYNENHKDNPYCNFVIDPKLNKLLQKYRNEVKEEYK